MQSVWKITKKRGVIKDHSETHIEGISHTFHICSKLSSTRKTLQVHISDVHSQQLFDCKNCGRLDMKKMTFKEHKRTCKGQ